MEKAVYIKVFGDVQGVSYRYWAKKEAHRVGLSGWARNDHDGSVHIFVQGPEALVDDYVNWSRVGSPMADVEGIEISKADLDLTIKRFEVR